LVVEVDWVLDDVDVGMVEDVDVVDMCLERGVVYGSEVLLESLWLVFLSIARRSYRPHVAPACLLGGALVLR